MKADNVHHGGICEYCYQTSPFVPVGEPRRPIEHLEDCQRDNPKAQARLKAMKDRQPRIPEHLFDAPFEADRRPQFKSWLDSLPRDEEYEQHQQRMKSAARSTT